MQRREPGWRHHRKISRNHIPGDLLCWLLDTASLTRRLQFACGDGFRVEVVSQRWGRPMRNEMRALNMRRGRYALIRQVRLMCNDAPWVFARTVIPRTTLTGRQRQLAGLGGRPLGAMLFADPGMRRGDLELSRIARGEQLYHLAVAGVRRKPDAVWGRRSLFFLSDKPLLVSEIFVPGILPCNQVQVTDCI